MKDETFLEKPHYVEFGTDSQKV